MVEGVPGHQKALVQSRQVVIGSDLDDKQYGLQMDLQVQYRKQEIESLDQRDFSPVCAQLSSLDGRTNHWTGRINWWVGTTIRAVMVDKQDTDVLCVGSPEGVIKLTNSLLKLARINHTLTTPKLVNLRASMPRPSTEWASIQS